MIPKRRRTQVALRTPRRKYVAYALLGVAALGVVLVQLPFARITSVVVVGAHQGQSYSLMTALADDALRTRTFLVWPNDTRLLYAKGSIERALTRAFPSVTGATFTVTDGALTVRVTEREVRARYCTDSDECYDMDATGYIFAPSAQLATFDRTYRGALSGTPIGATYGGSTFSELARTLDRIELVTGRKIIEVVFDGVDVFATFGSGGELWYSARADPDQLLGEVALIFESPSFRAKSSFAYVDFRFAPRVLVGDVPPVVPQVLNSDEEVGH